MNTKKETKKGILVDGFFFYDEKTAEQAKREAEGVRFIKEKMDKNQPEAVLQIYNQVILQNMFETPVGQTYLRDLQEYLLAVPEIEKQNILPIPVERRKHREAAQKEEKQQPLRKNADYKKKFETAFILNIAFVCCIVFMFLINLTTDSPTILNYETKLINKYEEWENELEEREQILEEKEAAQQ